MRHARPADAGVLLDIVGELGPGGEVGILKMGANMVKWVLSMQTVVSMANNLDGIDADDDD
jgi:hypothetical protein